MARLFLLLLLVAVPALSGCLSVQSPTSTVPPVVGPEIVGLAADYACPGPAPRSYQAEPCVTRPTAALGRLEGYTGVFIDPRDADVIVMPGLHTAPNLYTGIVETDPPGHFWSRGYLDVSEDGGATWEARPIPMPVLDLPVGIFDVAGPLASTQTPDGTISIVAIRKLVPVGGDGTEECPACTGIVVYRVETADAGASWSEPVELVRGPQLINSPQTPAAVTTPTGDALFFWFEDSEIRFLRRGSDGTWTQSSVPEAPDCAPTTATAVGSGVFFLCRPLEDEPPLGIWTNGTAAPAVIDLGLDETQAADYAACFPVASAALASGTVAFYAGCETPWYLEGDATLRNWTFHSPGTVAVTPSIASGAGYAYQAIMDDAGLVHMLVSASNETWYGLRIASIFPLADFAPLEAVYDTAPCLPRDAAVTCCVEPVAVAEVAGWHWSYGIAYAADEVFVATGECQSTTTGWVRTRILREGENVP